MCFVSLPPPLGGMALLKYNSCSILVVPFKVLESMVWVHCTQTQAGMSLSWHGWKRQCFCTTKKVAGHTEQQFSEEAVGSPGMPETLDRERSQVSRAGEQVEKAQAEGS